jgi:tetratricopeptide (TPR) repeat protein
MGILAERYIALGKIDDAYRVAQEGVSRFPTSERLASIHRFALKERHRAEISRLSKELKDNPTPTTYSQLAEVHRDLGNDELATKLCLQCIESFPLNENPYLILGEVRLKRFFEDKTSSDGLAAEEQLRRVVKLNNHNLKAHVLLSQLYHAVGAWDQLQEILGRAVTLAPENRELEEFRQRLAADPPKLVLNEEDAEFEDELDVLDLLRMVEQTGRFQGDPAEFPAGRFKSAACSTARLDMQSMKDGLTTFGREEGFLNAVILDRDGEPLGVHSDPESLTQKQFSELTWDIFTTSADASRRMDIGAFQWCTVEGAGWGITISRVKNITLGIKYQPPMKSERAEKLLREFAARNLTAAPEAHRA